MPALQPHLVGRPVSVSASGSRLLLHGPTRDLGVLIDLVAAIDVPVEMLWVTVVQDGGAPDPAAEPDTADSWGETRLGTGSTPRRDPAAQGYAVTRRWQTRGEDASRVLVREGGWAAVEVRRVPAAAGLAAQVQVTPWVEVYAPELTRPDPVAQRVFRVRPWLTGNRVTLELDFYEAMDDTRSREPKIQARRTLLSGRLGDWIPLGGQADLGGSEEATGIIARTRPGGMPNLLVRVTSATVTQP